jgi:ABC transporter
MAFLEVDGVYKTYANGTRALERIDLAVEAGEFVSLLGPSGCGKTTLLRIIAGFETPTGGGLCVDGHDITQVPPNRRKIGMVFQNYALFPNLTVAGNIGFGMTVTGASRKEINVRVHELLEMTHCLATPVVTPISSLEVNNNVWRWHAPWPFDHAYSCWTSLSAHWTHRSASPCDRRFAPSNSSCALPPFTSPTTRMKPCRCPIVSS